MSIGELYDYTIKLQEKLKEAEREVSRENKSHNYHCKESQRKNDVIETLTDQINLLTKCVDSCEEYGFINKCQGCKNKQQLENMESSKE